jgi:hypothetical protein
MFRTFISISISKRYCHHHSKRVFEAPNKCKTIDEINIMKANEQIYKEQLQQLHEQVTKIDNNLFLIHLINLCVFLPIIVFGK